jgi:hypothetical protein
MQKILLDSVFELEHNVTEENEVRADSLAGLQALPTAASAMHNYAFHQSDGGLADFGNRRSSRRLVNAGVRPLKG